MPLPEPSRMSQLHTRVFRQRGSISFGVHPRQEGLYLHSHAFKDLLKWGTCDFFLRSELIFGNVRDKRICDRKY